MQEVEYNTDGRFLAGREYNKKSIHSTRWGWEEESICFFWRFSREFRYMIIDGKIQWKVGPWYRFIQNQSSRRE